MPGIERLGNLVSYWSSEEEAQEKAQNKDIHMYGCFLFEVCAGVSHCNAVHLSVVFTSI